MSGFSHQWLALREPVDLRARNAAVREAFVSALKQRQARLQRPLTLLDLGSGTGASARALSPHLPFPHRWRLAEFDPALIAVARELALPGETPVEVIEADLADGVPPALLGGVDAVTTSAFLDLVSSDWLDRLAGDLARARLPFLAMLTYDGRMSVSPPHPFDETVRAAMNTHQRGDKGFGPALGPQAADHAAHAFAAAGFKVTEGPSDWQARSNETGFQEMLLDGWIAAAEEIGIDREGLVGFAAAHRKALAEKRLTSHVGHRDMAALID
ncbi:class I SAM-dependent methyltransferase [Stappia indica]|uniref:class I SAM-dependent methyltransferase n=1 Tax=Stappia indica TaxID=538381 RepID=UPI001CD60970|nr:class I SAM-dependent methyltransferase [Stappia indica]MCA1299140.1 class I SAM-dependent methyltransferase [Stappia indica]